MRDLFEVWKGMRFFLDGMRFEVQACDPYRREVDCAVRLVAPHEGQGYWKDRVRFTYDELFDLLPGEPEPAVPA